MLASSRYAIIGLLCFLTACTTTITKLKDPEFAVPVDSLADEIHGVVASQHINVVGKTITTNGKDSTALEITVINGKDIPQDQTQEKALGRAIAVDVHGALKDKNEYKALLVIFMKVDSGETITKKTWTAFEFPAGGL